MGAHAEAQLTPGASTQLNDQHSPRIKRGLCEAIAGLALYHLCNIYLGTCSRYATMNNLSRREFLGVVGAGALATLPGWRMIPPPPEFRIRTITAGITLGDATDLDAMHSAVEFLSAARGRLAETYEVQTTRIATQPLAHYLPDWRSPASIDAIAELDRIAVDAGAMFNVGPVLTDDNEISGFGSWAADLIAATSNTSLSSFVASERGLHARSMRAAAEAIAAIARTSPGGEGNFRFCATAFCPPGTPFFPAAYHDGEPAFSIGLESPRLLAAALAGTQSRTEAIRSMKTRLNEALAPVEALAEDIAAATGRRYLGIDTSPAPGLDASIGEVIESLAGVPFGAAGTMSACSAITTVLQGLMARTCGYSGLMLPVLEDTLLAQRAVEERYGVDELLLYSSVCGTGLDVVPLPGDTTVESLEATIGDVAALAARYRKPLSARLFPVPGKSAGDLVDFENPFLTGSRVMAVG